MGFISGSASFSRYLAGGPPQKELLEGLTERIARFSFRRLDEHSPAERSAGWVNIMDMFDTRFAGAEFLKEPYIAMSLRIDERKIPSTALKQFCREAEEEAMREENLEFLPKRRRRDIQDAVRALLLKRAIPVSGVHDMIWNYTTGLVLFGCTAARICDEFMELFLQTFDIQLQAVCPHILAANALEKAGLSADLIDGLGPSLGSEAG